MAKDAPRSRTSLARTHDGAQHDLVTKRARQDRGDLRQWNGRWPRRAGGRGQISYPGTAQETRPAGYWTAVTSQTCRGLLVCVKRADRLATPGSRPATTFSRLLSVASLHGTIVRSRVGEAHGTAVNQFRIGVGEADRIDSGHLDRLLKPPATCERMREEREGRSTSSWRTARANGRVTGGDGYTVCMYIHGVACRSSGSFPKRRSAKIESVSIL